MPASLEKGIVKSATLTIGSTAHKIYEMPIRKGLSRDAVEVTDLSDTTKTYVAGAVEEWPEFTIKVADSGQSIATSIAAQSMTITANLTDGTNTQAYTETFNALVTKVESSTYAGDGDRKAALTLTIRPDGTTPSSAS